MFKSVKKINIWTLDSRIYLVVKKRLKYQALGIFPDEDKAIFATEILDNAFQAEAVISEEVVEMGGEEVGMTGVHFQQDPSARTQHLRANSKKV